MAGPIRVLSTPEYDRWYLGIKDATTSRRIAARIFRLEAGLVGEARAVGGGVNELKLDFGPGYRIYYARKGDVAVLLICGGDKSSQPRDIAKARQIWDHWKDEI